VSTVVGTIAALGMQRFEFRGKGVLDSLFYTCDHSGDSYGRVSRDLFWIHPI
jgi:hypothetical protein